MPFAPGFCRPSKLHNFVDGPEPTGLLLNAQTDAEFSANAEIAASSHKLKANKLN
jgi:hypothetical protein